jgi:transposase
VQVAGDAPEGGKLLQAEGEINGLCFLIMDRAYEGDETRELAEKLGYIPVVPPKKNRLEPWSYDRELYKRRNEAERLFRRLNCFRRLATRYDKLDSMFLAFIVIACIFQFLK